MGLKRKNFANKGKAPAADDEDDDVGTSEKRRKNCDALPIPSDQFDIGNANTEAGFATDMKKEELDIELIVRNSSVKSLNTLLVPKEELIDEEEFERIIEKRFQKHFGRMDDEDVRRSEGECSYLPSTKDISIWRLKCMVGRERILVCSLMQKFVHLKYLKNDFQIISAFTVDHIKGYIFIEGDKEYNVVEACKGIVGLYYSKLEVIPIKEISLLLSFRQKSTNLKKGMWVRMASGIYKGDLGQVVSFDKARMHAKVKLVPRIDPQALALKYGGAISRAKSAASCPRLISAFELAELGPLVQERHNREIGGKVQILGGMMLKDGFLYKNVPVDSLFVLDVCPSEDELLKFKSLDNPHSNPAGWLSELYPKVRNRSVDSKNMVNGQCSSASMITNKFELCELVFWGRKEYGLVIGIEKDNNYKILKNESEGPVATIVSGSKIKHGPSGAKFTAFDKRRKVIFIDDNVRVLEGSLKDREGAVKKMYKGTLFIYDENGTENNGYFCCDSQSCEKFVSSFAGGSSSPNSPLRSGRTWDARNNFHESAEDSNSGFSVGQKLRIRVGPLKGHLCQVLKIRQSDITVKLDSRQNVLKVKSEHVCEVRKKNSSEGDRNGEANVAGWNTSWNAPSASFDDLWRTSETEGNGANPTPNSSRDDEYSKKSGDGWNTHPEALPRSSSWDALVRESDDRIGGWGSIEPEQTTSWSKAGYVDADNTANVEELDGWRDAVSREVDSERDRGDVVVDRGCSESECGWNEASKEKFPRYAEESVKNDEVGGWGNTRESGSDVLPKEDEDSRWSDACKVESSWNAEKSVNNDEVGGWGKTWESGFDVPEEDEDSRWRNNSSADEIAESNKWRQEGVEYGDDGKQLQSCGGADSSRSGENAGNDDKNWNMESSENFGKKSAWGKQEGLNSWGNSTDGDHVNIERGKSAWSKRSSSLGHFREKSKGDDEKVSDWNKQEEISSRGAKGHGEHAHNQGGKSVCSGRQEESSNQQWKSSSWGDSSDRSKLDDKNKSDWKKQEGFTSGENSDWSKRCEEASDLQWKGTSRSNLIATSQHVDQAELAWDKAGEKCTETAWGEGQKTVESIEKETGELAAWGKQGRFKNREEGTGMSNVSSWGKGWDKAADPSSSKQDTSWTNHLKEPVVDAEDSVSSWGREDDSGKEGCQISSG